MINWKWLKDQVDWNHFIMIWIIIIAGGFALGWFFLTMYVLLSIGTHYFSIPLATLDVVATIPMTMLLSLKDEKKKDKDKDDASTHDSSITD